MFKKYILTTLIFLCSACSFAVQPPQGYVNTDAKLEYNKGIDFYNTGQFDKAIECFRNAIDLEPNYIDAYYNLGATFEYLKQYEASISVFRELLKRKPNDYAAAYRGAIVSYKTKNIGLTKEFLSKIPAASPFYYQAQELAVLIGTDMQTLANSVPQMTASAPQTNEKSVTSPSNEDLPVLPDIKIKDEPQNSNPTFAGNFYYEGVPSPTGIATDDVGYLYVADYSDNAIFRITPTGEKTIYLKSPKIKGPIGLAIDDDGNMYIANYDGNNILKLSNSNQLTTFIEDIEKPYYLYVSGNFIFISSQGNNTVLRYKLD